jgi:hypothetical protein
MDHLPTEEIIAEAQWCDDHMCLRDTCKVKFTPPEDKFEPYFKVTLDLSQFFDDATIANARNKVINSIRKDNTLMPFVYEKDLGIEGEERKKTVCVTFMEPPFGEKKEALMHKALDHFIDAVNATEPRLAQALYAKLIEADPNYAKNQIEIYNDDLINRRNPEVVHIRHRANSLGLDMAVRHNPLKTHTPSEPQQTLITATLKTPFDQRPLDELVNKLKQQNISARLFKPVDASELPNTDSLSEKDAGRANRETRRNLLQAGSNSIVVEAQLSTTLQALTQGKKPVITTELLDFIRGDLETVQRMRQQQR